MPVWTSSNTSAAPTASHASRAARSTSSGIGCTPDSPSTGSISTAAVLRVDRRADRVHGRRDRPEARHQRRERRLLGLLRRGRQRAVGAAVERAVEDDDVAARARLAHELQRGLVGLRAGVAEEHDDPKDRVDEPVREPHHRRVEVQVRRRASAAPPAPGSPRPRAGGSGRCCRPRCRTGSRGTRCRRSRPARSPSRTRTRPGSARTCWPARSRGGPDLGALAGVGEQLEQHRVRHPPVDDVREATRRRGSRPGRPAASAASRRP